LWEFYGKVFLRWKGGKMERWKGGKMERWKGGKVEWWKGGKVKRFPETNTTRLYTASSRASVLDP